MFYKKKIFTKSVNGRLSDSQQLFETWKLKIGLNREINEDILITSNVSLANC